MPGRTDGASTWRPAAHLGQCRRTGNDRVFAIAMDATDGVTKLLVDPESRRILGAGVVGPHAGELVAEIGLAIEMGAEAGDVALTVHAHPTLSETIGLAAEVAEGTVTDLPAQRRRG